MLISNIYYFKNNLHVLSVVYFKHQIQGNEEPQLEWCKG